MAQKKKASSTPAPASLDAITRLSRCCDPTQPIGPDDPRYVYCDHVRGRNIVEEYARDLRRAAPDRPDTKLFAGHRGIGKTSELKRLKQELENPQSGSPFLVVFFDVAESLDVNDLDFPDLLVCVADQVQTQLRVAKAPGTGRVSTLLKNAWEEIKETLGSDVALKEAEVDAGFAKLTGELRNRPNSRRKLRDAIELHNSSLLNGVRDMLTNANVALRTKASLSGLVIIIDGLDKVERRPLDDGASNTHDRLFIDRSRQLCSLGVHTVFTVPISLYYSTRAAQLEQALGEFNRPIPMIRLHEREDPEVSPESPGMQALVEILKRRCDSADVTLADVFDSDATRDLLCQMTGGHPRHLLAYVQAACSYLDELPITRAAVDQAVRDYANSLLRQIPDEYWQPLQRFSTPQTDFPTDEAHQEMLFHLHVFEYMNHAPWYEVNPVLRTLEKFNAS
jgi:hypothetical protein